MKNINIYLIRHAESIGNTIPDTINQDPETPLTEKGVIQANLLGRRFRNGKLSFDEIVSSTYRRAMETADIVAKITEYKAEIPRVHELREYDAGDWKGKKRSEVYSDLKNMKDLAYLNMGLLFPNGESYHQVERRAASYLEENIIYNDCVLKQAENKELHLCVVSHGMTIKSILHYVMNFDTSFIWRTRIGNTGIQHLVYDEFGWKVNSINDQGHLL
jgi:2,3-bisphosphoglycerate-dependent phosphoglycerate mutase